jgi:drug/metabolite transporter (DMT)-like permease
VKVKQTGVFFGLLAGAFWGFSFLVPRLLPGISPRQIAFGRFEWFGLFSVIALFRQGGFHRNGVVFRYWRPALILALAGYSFYYLLLVASIQRIGIPISSLIVGLIPVTVSLFSRDPIERPGHFYFGLTGIVVGMGILNRQAFLHEPALWQLESGIGILLALVCLLLWSYFAVMNARFLKSHPEIKSSEWSSVLGVYTALATLILDPLVRGLNLEGSAVKPEALGDPKFLICTGGLGLFSTFFATRLWNRASLVLPTGLVAQLIVSETFFALVYSFLYDQKFPKLAEWIAMSLVLGGVMLAIRAYQIFDVTPKLSRSENL